MNAYQAALLGLIAGLAGQAIAGGLAFDRYLRLPSSTPGHRLWLALACAGLLLSAAHGQALELAVRTGLYDLRQALFAGAAGVLYAVAVIGLRRQS